MPIVPPAQLPHELQLITDGMPALVSYIGPDLRYRFVNYAYVSWFGHRREEVIGKTMPELLGAEAFAAIRPRVERALAGEVVTYEEWVPYRDGGTRFVKAHYLPRRDPEGRLDGFIALVDDNTAGKRAEERLAFIAEASHVLASSLDYEQTLAAITRVAVPRLADWVALDLLIDERTTEQVAVAHVDPEKVKFAIEMRRQFPPDPASSGGMWQTLRTGSSQMVAHVSDEMLVKAARGPEHLAMIRRIGLRSYIVVPIAQRGRVLGALSLVSSSRDFEQADLTLAEELAVRAALAIDNARLFREAQDATRRKDEFLAMLGHELRNPLAPIATALEIMRLRGDTSSFREQNVIARQVHHLGRLVDDLLDVSRVTRGKIELRLEPVEIAAVLAKSIEIVSPLLEQKSHALSVQVPATGMVVDADLVRLSQVFANLLSNAAKYSEPRGQVTVRARRAGDRIAIDVIDSGVGISPELLPGVFDLFVQGAQPIDRAQGGLGIGLMLARNLVELHGGSIDAHSDGDGQGSRFTVTLPALAGVTTVAPAPPWPARAGSSIKPSTRRRKLLVVDDNIDAVATLADALRIAGHEVTSAHDGPEALAVCDRFLPDAAILDIGLPVMDGYQLARRLRDRLGDQVQLFAVTGYGLESDIQRSVEAGFERHFVKPLDLAALLSALDRPRLS
jgi:PAS domain S-box-containing protein